MITVLFLAFGCHSTFAREPLIGTIANTLNVNWSFCNSETVCVRARMCFIIAVFSGFMSFGLYVLDYIKDVQQPRVDDISEVSMEDNVSPRSED